MTFDEPEKPEYELGPFVIKYPNGSRLTFNVNRYQRRAIRGHYFHRRFNSTSNSRDTVDPQKSSTSARSTATYEAEQCEDRWLQQTTRSNNDW